MPQGYFSQLVRSLVVAPGDVVKLEPVELVFIARRYNETADELAKIASGRTTVPPDVFSRDLHQPSVKIDDTPAPTK